MTVLGCAAKMIPVTGLPVLNCPKLKHSSGVPIVNFFCLVHFAFIRKEHCITGLQHVILERNNDEEGHFRIPKTLTFNQMRGKPSAKPFFTSFKKRLGRASSSRS